MHGIYTGPFFLSLTSLYLSTSNPLFLSVSLSGFGPGAGACSFPPPNLRLQGMCVCHTQIGSGVGGAGSISAASHPAVWSSCREMKLLKLTYYLLDWANMFFLFSCTPFLIESGRVITGTVMPKRLPALGYSDPLGAWCVCVCACIACECVSMSFMVYVCGRMRVWENVCVLAHV